MPRRVQKSWAPRVNAVSVRSYRSNNGLLAVISAFVASGSQSDSRDVISSVILGLAGVGITVMGAAVFLRYSLGRFLRAWMLRLVYEQQQRP